MIRFFGNLFICLFASCLVTFIQYLLSQASAVISASQEVLLCCGFLVLFLVHYCYQEIADNGDFHLPLHSLGLKKAVEICKIKKQNLAGKHKILTYISDHYCEGHSWEL